MSYKRFDPEDIVISAESATTSCWSNNLVTLSTFFTSSVQVNSTAGDFQYEVYNGDPTLDTSAVQFSIGYGHIKGSGSVPFNPDVPGNTPSSAIFGQYRNLILGDEESDLTFGSGDNAVTTEDFYFINIDRARYKEKILPGSLQLVITNPDNSNTLTLTDTSATTTTQTYTDAGRVYELKSNLGTTVTGAGSYGKLLPDIGVILLNPSALAATSGNGGIGLTTGDSPTSANSKKLYNILKEGASFKLSSEETLSSNFVFVRARNSEFNYTTNPSILTGSGELRYDELIDSPQTYVTTVGLYNDNNDLLSVAKLSRPLLKDFTKEILLRIKLDF